MPTIDIYTTPMCSSCRNAKAIFNEKKIEFREHDVIKNPMARQELLTIAPNNTAVPVIIFDKGTINQKIEIGFDPIRLQKLINQ